MKKKKQKQKHTALLILALLILAYGGSVMMDIFGNENGNRHQVTVTAGAGTAEIAKALSEADIIRHPFWFRVCSKLGGHDGTFQHGTYTLYEGTAYGSLFSFLKRAPSPEAVTVTIPEGFELRQIADRLEEKGLIDREKFYDAVENAEFEYDFLKGIPKRENRLEGYLFPDTYQFQKDAGEKAILDKMLARFDEIYTKEYRDRAKELGMTDDELITLASVIEREAAGGVDRGAVAGVFHNRLKSSSYPYLESCATVQYILRERKPVLSIADTKIKSPYNTYENPGLPVGPIASPGADAIHAALYPQQHDYLFFALDSSGTHRFAKTYEEHQANMRK